MLRRSALLAVLAALAWGSAPAESREQEELQVSLTTKTPSFKTKEPELFMNGVCPLSDGVILKLTLSRIVESMVGIQIQPMTLNAGGRTVEISGKKFSHTQAIGGPGKYSIQVSILEDLQEKHLAAEVKKKTASKHDWYFEVLVWGDDLVPMLGGKLNELQAHIQDTRELIKKFEKAISSEQGWKADMKGLVQEGNKFLAKMENNELRAFFPATLNALHFTVQNVVGSAPYYLFDKDGKFAGAKDYHTDGKKVLTFRGDEFNWDTVRRYMDDAVSSGGREFCLWVIKDLRRTASPVRPEVQEALKHHKGLPGVDVYWERLSKAGISDLDPLETEIRGVKPTAKDKQ